MMAGYLVEIFQLNTNRATNSTEDFDRQLAQCNSNKTVWVWDDSVASLSAKSQVIFSPRHYGNRPSRSTPNENCDHRWSFLGSVFDAQTEKQKNKIFSDLLRCAMADKIALILFYENILCCCCRCFHHSLRYCNEQEADSLYVIFFFLLFDWHLARGTAQMFACIIRNVRLCAWTKHSCCQSNRFGKNPMGGARFGTISHQLQFILSIWRVAEVENLCRFNVK